jgi:trigger factor
MASQYQQYGLPAPDDQELTQTASRVLANKEEGQKIYEMLLEEKLIQFFKDTVKLTDNAVSYDDFIKVAQDTNA